MSAGTANISAARPIRAATAAPDVQPASVSVRANDPEVAKQAEESNAKLSPTPTF
jgi:hypothetical protein